jgi:ATP-dependent DNA helicase PIF1
MLVRNMDEDLVNGTFGTVLGYASPRFASEPDLEERMTDPEEFSITVSSTNILLPVVRWEIPGQPVLPPTLVKPFKFIVDPLGLGDSPVWRKQLPIVLSYAITVHKAQGQTLDRVVLDMNHMFAPGQAYVGLTRCRDPSRLHIVGWSPSAVKVDSEVTRWYEEVLAGLVASTNKRLPAVLKKNARPKRVASL